MGKSELPLEWKDQGRCKGKSKFFYSDLRSDHEKAKRICRECEVQRKCLAYALVNDEDYGIWGGSTATDRKLIKKLCVINPDFNSIQLSILNGIEPVQSESSDISFNFYVETVFSFRIAI